MSENGFPASEMPSRSRGRMLFWGLILVGTISGSASLAGKAIHAATLRAEVESLTQEAHQIYDGFQRFEERTGAYPNSFLSPAFERNTTEPLRRRGYYLGKIEPKLLNSRFDAYDAPDDRGINREFWLEMTLASDPSVRVVVARSDDAPVSGGSWLDGVYLVKRDGLEQI